MACFETNYDSESIKIAGSTEHAHHYAVRYPDMGNNVKTNDGTGMIETTYFFMSQ
jgi:hypothetical protein